MKKKIFSFLIVTCALFMITCVVYAASYTGSYNMTGGIFYKRAFSKGTKLTITVKPEKGTSSCQMNLYTAKKNLLGKYSGADLIGKVSSTNKDSITYTTKSKIDGIYFRNYSGNKWIGTFTVKW